MVNLLLIISIVLITYSTAIPKTRIKDDLDWRIVGGNSASHGQFPYQISLQFQNNHYCGGSILGSQWIVTAAHCVDGAKPSDFKILAGTVNLNPGGILVELSRIIVHPDFDYTNASADIALLKTSVPLKLDGETDAIAIGRDVIGENIDAVFSGWGATSYPGEITNNLQYINLKTISVSECKSKHSPTPVGESQICTFTKMGEGACYGDSGGPLVANNELIGILSWSRPCAEGYPDVFTRVSYYADWIFANTQ